MSELYQFYARFCKERDLKPVDLNERRTVAKGSGLSIEYDLSLTSESMFIQKWVGNVTESSVHIDRDNTRLVSVSRNAAQDYILMVEREVIQMKPKNPLRVDLEMALVEMQEFYNGNKFISVSFSKTTADLGKHLFDLFYPA